MVREKEGGLYPEYIISYFLSFTFLNNFPVYSTPPPSPCTHRPTHLPSSTVFTTFKVLLVKFGLKIYITFIDLNLPKSFVVVKIRLKLSLHLKKKTTIQLLKVRKELFKTTCGFGQCELPRVNLLLIRLTKFPKFWFIYGPNLFFTISMTE